MKSIKKLKNYKYILFIVLIISFFLRFWNLGYSHFYGDETKTLYLDKTQPAIEFFMNQRKGPVQFSVVWFTEKIIGGHDEFLTRIPFALAGSLSILVLFLIVQKIAGNVPALISTALFGFNGFYIAFSRTIQYQSFLVLFGLTAIYLALLYEEEEDSKTRKGYAVASGLSLGLSYLCHYDAVFFDIVIAFILVKVLVDHKDEFWKKLVEMSVYLVVPAVLLTGLFYVPYVIYGFYMDNTVNYIGKRLIGYDYAINSSWYTFWVYNPHIIWAFLSVFIVPFLLKRSNWKRNLLLFWFLVPFITFQFIFSDPGTHIHNYFLPFLVIISIGMADFIKLLSQKVQRQYFYAFLIYVFGLIFVVDLFVFIPEINRGYPWKNSRFLGREVSKLDRNFHLFMYGFPYDRAWDDIQKYVNEHGEIRKIYTNDNATVAKYYTRGVHYTIPGPNYLPPYFVYVYDNQETLDIPPDMRIQLDDDTLEEVYKVEKRFYVEGEVASVLYKKREGVE